MNQPTGAEPFLEPLAVVQRLLSRFDNRGVILGGLAVSLLGRPRYTVDVDAMFLLSVDDIQTFLDAASEEGLEPRIENAVGFARKNRVLLLRHTASDTKIDISLGILPFEQEVVARSTVRSVGSISVRLPTPEDLIVMKAVAHRPKDLLDIQAIVEKNPGLDVARIKDWVMQFAEALEMPSLWEDIEGFFKG